MDETNALTFEDIPGDVIEKWQGIADLLASIISVPAALIMKAENEYMEVFISSKSSNNPYHAGNKEKWHGLYCETVIRTQKALLIPDAVTDPRWQNSPDVKSGMIAYLGYPINFPDKKPFGTLCVLDTKKHHFSTDHQNLLKQFCNVLETDLAHIKIQRDTKDLSEKLQKTEFHYRTLADSGQALIWTSGIDKKCDYFNQPWFAFTGSTYEQEQGDGWTQGVHPDDLQNCINCYTQAFDRREKFIMNYRLRHVSGEYRWIQDTGSPRYDHKGEFLGYIGHCLDISNLKKIENVLRENVDFTRAVMDNLPIGLAVNSVDPLVDFSYMNDNFSAIYRTTRESLSSVNSFWEAVYEDPDFREIMKQRVLKDCGSGDPDKMHWENVPITRQGKIAGYVSAQNFPVPGKNLMLSLVWDVTEQKKAEEVLLQSEERFRAIVEGAPDAVYVQTDMKFAYINTRAIDLFGAEHETDLLGLPVIDRFHPDSQQAVLNRLKRLNDERQPVECLELRFLRLDGRELWVETSGQPIIFDGKKGALVFVRDITERKQSEMILAAEKERLAVTLRSIGDGVITTDTTGAIVLMNKVAETLTGWKLDEAAGKKLEVVFNIINETTREPHENPVQKVLSSGKIIELANHTLLISRDGNERVIADSGAPILDQNGTTIGVVLVFRDTTEKQKFLDLAQNTQKLDSLGILAGGIAHDFNNLLGGIYGFIDMAIECVAQNDTASRYLTKAMNSIDRARDLTRQLLTFAKGGVPVQKVEALFPFIQETAQFALSGSNVTCRIDIPQDLWCCNYDKNQIGQVIDNLIINAQQAMPTGGTIVITAGNISLANKEHPMLSKGKYVKISLKDTGIGIPREMLSKIFDPFFTTKIKGHGLGLAMCYSIINRHNGCIDVESEPGKGSTFHLYLPAAEMISTSVNENPIEPHKGSGIFLIMDDEEVVRDIITAMLESFGYSVVCKDNGKDAVEYFETEIKANRPLAGMIFDLTIPGGMGGKEAVVEIRKLSTNIPVFVSSGYADGPVMINPADYGFTASLCKPFRRIELMEMLEKHMKK